MSASLVGSEMCIRDSSRMSPTLPRPSLPPVRARAPAPTTGASPRASWKPVSYTHLTLPTICSV
eukprot:8236668-Alexandrium_andersonii.AAC.1